MGHLVYGVLKHFYAAYFPFIALIEPEYKILQISRGSLAVSCNSLHTLQWNTKYCNSLQFLVESHISPQPKLEQYQMTRFAF